MIDLSKTFLQCMHCHHNFSEPRHVCPSCDWPRAHSDKTPPPTWSQPDTSKVEVSPQLQLDLGIINLDPAKPAEPAPLAVPQAPPTILADIPVPSIKPRKGVMRATQTLTLTPEEPTGEAK